MNKLKQAAQEALDFVELISETGAQDMRGWLTLYADPKGVDRLQKELRAAIKDEPDWVALIGAYAEAMSEWENAIHSEVFPEDELLYGKAIAADKALRETWRKHSCTPSS